MPCLYHGEERVDEGDIPEHVDCVLFGGFDYLLLDVLVNWGLDRTHESGAYDVSHVNLTL